jgi:hypothetical protein
METPKALRNASQRRALHRGHAEGTQRPHVVEIRDATGVSLLLTAAEWTDGERKVATSAILIGFKAAAPATRKASKASSGEGPSAKARQKK